MESFSYFPAIVYRDERPDLIEKVLPICKHYLDQVRQPNWPMIQSDHLAGHPDMKDIANYLLQSSVGILQEQGYNITQYEFYLQGLWAQEVAKNGGTNVHVHKNSQICGWFFLESPEGGAYPVYHDTRMNKSMIELDFVQTNDITNATNTIYFNNMKPGTVLFSNSWMQHQLVSGTSERPSLCIHFIVSHR